MASPSKKRDIQFKLHEGKLEWGESYYISADNVHFTLTALEKLMPSQLDNLPGETPGEKAKRCTEINRNIQQDWVNFKKKNMVYV
jgi:hypothetical protein